MRFVIFALLLNLGTTGWASATPVKDVSIVQLIANPERYDGQDVRVIGFMRLEFEGDALYLHREDFEHSILNNGVWIDLTDSQQKSSAKFNNSYVLVEGRFSASEKGHLELWSGSLQRISRLNPWPIDRGKRTLRKR